MSTEFQSGQLADFTIFTRTNVLYLPTHLTRSNLNTGENVLYMYNQENKTLFSSSKWYKDERFKISSAVIEKHQRDETGYAKRYDKNNAANKLKLFHFFVTSLDRSRVEQVREREMVCRTQYQ